jgi:hypothetical protein
MERKSLEVRLGVEEVEQRLLLAATVDVSNGQLGILGTTGNDTIALVEFANAAPVPAALRGQYAVVAKDTINTSNAVNTGVGPQIPLGGGFFARVVDANLFNNDVQIKLGDGNDTLTVGTGPAGIPIPAGILGQVLLPDDLRIDAGSGSDTISITNTAILNHSDDNSDKGTASLDIKLGSGNNKLTITNTTVDGRVSITGENGQDQILIVGSDFGDKVVLDLGDGNDIVAISGNFADTVKIGLGDGNDQVALGPSNFAKRLTISGDGGTDAVSVVGAGPTFGGGLSQTGVETKI